jgi:hypothetical protein
MPVIPDAFDGLPVGQVVKLKGIAECLGWSMSLGGLPIRW